MNTPFQRSALVLLSLMLNGLIVQSEITEFYFSENSWRNHVNEKIAGGIKQSANHDSELSEVGSVLLEELKNAEYLSPLPSLEESYADGVYFTVEELFPLRPLKATSQVNIPTKLYSRYDTRNFIADVNTDGNVVISQNFRPENEKSTSIVVLTYLDDVDKNAAALVVADTHTILYSATGAMLKEQEKSIHGDKTADVNAAAFFSDEITFLVQAFLFFIYIAFVCILRPIKKPRVRNASAKQTQPLLIPEPTVFLENKVLLDLVRSPKIPTATNF